MASPMSVALRCGTASVHRAAERSGFMRALLQGRMSTVSYRAWLLSLHAVYYALESTLDALAIHPWVEPVRMPILFRASALAHDLRQLPEVGARKPSTAARTYIEHLQSIGDTDPRLLVAHCYVRYLGDLSGGQMLRKVLTTKVGLPEASCQYYRFGDGTPETVERLKRAFRDALDRLPASTKDIQEVVREAVLAFEYHQQLVEELEETSAAASTG